MVAITVFFVRPATFEGKKVQIIKPGRVPNTWRMYIPHLVQSISFVGSKARAIMPEKAGTRESIMRMTAKIRMGRGNSNGKWTYTED